MPLSTAAKVAIGVTVGAVTLGGGVAIARARKKPGPKMKRGDGALPADADRKVVQIDFDTLYESSEYADGYPIDVGTRYELAFPKDAAAEFTAGRRIGSVKIAKVVNGEAQLDKAWAIDTDSFQARHNDLTVGFDLGSKTLSVTADRAGLYVVALLDREGVEVLDDMLFFATAPKDEADDAGGLVPRGTGPVDAGTKRFADIYEFYSTAVVEGPSRAAEIVGGRATFPAKVGETLEVPNVSAELPLRDARNVSITKLLAIPGAQGDQWTVEVGKLPGGFAVGTDFAVEYVATSDTLRLKANRAGRYRLEILGAVEAATAPIFAADFITS